MGEMSSVSRVLFPADFNTAAAVMRGVYQTQGQIWTIVVSKGDSVPDLFTQEEADRLLRDGAIGLDWLGHHPHEARIVLTAIGAYQLVEISKASARLTEHSIAHSVVYMLEPGRFRTPRGARETAHAASSDLASVLYPASVEARLFLTHTRPEPLLG